VIRPIRRTPRRTCPRRPAALVEFTIVVAGPGFLQFGIGEPVIGEPPERDDDLDS
jgi:hypothetical protein